MAKLITEEMADQITDGAIHAINGKLVLITLNSLRAAKQIFRIVAATSSIMYSSTAIDEDMLSIAYEDGGLLIFGTKETKAGVDITINIE